MHLSRAALTIAVTLVLGACATTDDGSAMDPTSTSTSSPSASETESALSTPSAIADPSVAESPSSPADVSPTATPPEAGTDEAARWAATVPAFEEYWEVINDTYAAGGAPEATERMKRTMTGTQLDFWEKFFADFAKQDRYYEGENLVTGANATLVEIGPESGTAEIEYCVDMSDTTAFESNGDPLVKDGDYQSGVAGLVWIDGRWKVAGFTPESGVVPSC